MFILSEISDLIRIPPHTFHIPISQSVNNELSKKYSNKVISNLGLAVAVWDIQDIKDGLLKPGEGAAFVEVKFRLIVWKPFVGEVLTGWVSENLATGIKVKTDFFDDIFIPKMYLFEQCVFRPDDNAWVWQADEDSELYIDVNEKIRFRIEQEVFTNIKPKPVNQVPNNEQEEKPKVPPYTILASCQTDGMGCVSWWE